MEKWILPIFICFHGFVMGQKLEITIDEETPYYTNEEINVSIYLNNNTTDTIYYFDSRGPSWESFKETWDLNVNSKSIETPPLNNAFEDKYSDTSIVQLNPGSKNLIRTRTFPLEIVGEYSLTYTQEQSPTFVNKFWADSTVSDSLIHKISSFKVYNNVQFTVYKNWDTTINELNTMTWEEWKDFRHVKLYSRDKHFDNLFAAFRYPEEVYALTLYCTKMTAEDIKRIGRLKNLKALTLRNYEVDHLPKEIVNLDLYELTIIPVDDTVVVFPDGLSKNNTLRELTARFYDSLPKGVLSQKHLIHLDISDSQIKTLPDLSPLKNLEVFDANNNSLTTLEGVHLDSLKMLRELNLSGNRNLNDLNPLLTCTNLEFLIMNRTSVPAIPQDIEQLSNLKRLSISSEITQISDSIGNLADMRFLSFGGNTELDSLPQSIVKMSKLLHFDISRTNIKELPEGISELPIENVNILHAPIENSKDYRVLKRRLEENFKE